MPRQHRSSAIAKVYRRGSSARFYVDLREYGGGREALVPPGQCFATTDERIALDLAARRIERLEADRRREHFTGQTRTVSIGTISREWIAAKRAKAGRNGNTSAATIARYESGLRSLFRVLDQDSDVASITRRHITDALSKLQETPARAGRPPLGGSSIRQIIVAMQQILDYAADTGAVPEGHNPWRALRRSDRPRLPARSSTDFLESYEAHALLIACDKVPNRTIPLTEVVATLLLTGARKREVLGLEWPDVDFRRRTIRFRGNQWRDIKTRDERTVPMWPQLERILRDYVRRADRTTRLVFPGRERHTGREHLITGLLEPLSRASRIASDMLGPELGPRLLEKRIHPRALRPTYCAQRLQTLDRGEPVAMLTVQNELGHDSIKMIIAVYGRVGRARHRSEIVEYLPLDEITRCEILGVDPQLTHDAGGSTTL